MTADLKPMGGYVIAAWETEVLDAGVDAGLEALRRAGWTVSLDGFGVRILTGPTCPWPVAQVHRRHALLGEWRGAGAHPSAIAGRSRTAETLARGMISEGWGAYLMVWRDDAGRLNLLRDPSGAVDAVWWRHGGTTFVTDGPPSALDALLPAELAIDWERLGDILRTPALLTDDVPLAGLSTVGAGSWVQPAGGIDRSLWRPADFARRVVDDAPHALANVVDHTVDRIMRTRRTVVAELSGGLDSAIVAGALVATGHAAKATFVNYYGDDPEGDERRYAKAAARLSGLSLQTVRKPVAALTAEDFAPLGVGLRPALQGVDVAYDRDAARRLSGLGADGLLTGQGGDSVLFHAPDPRVVADLVRRRGVWALSPSYLAAVGRWTRCSAWTVAKLALGAAPSPSAGPRHAWSRDLDDLPPAKRGQVERFVSNQLFWTDCLRARQAPLLNPLLGQPVVEHCLGVPTDRLTLGARDRGLARSAFADRLPAEILERRSKGDLSAFYGRVTRDSLPALLTLLIDGRLVANAVIDRTGLIRDLDADRLLWSQGANQPLLAAVLEVWSRRWEARIARRRAEVARKPV